ncbi:MAG: ComF family protein [Eggerthellaceae bacterium]|nr:ComF family protein [Eggerthellaceae bacterium]
MKKSRSAPHIARSTLATAAAVALEALWPTRCAVCDCHGELLCDKCRRTLPYIDANLACPRCGAPFGCVVCTECNDESLSLFELEQFPFDQMASAVSLTDESRRLVTVFKDSGERRLAGVVAAIMAEYVPPAWKTPEALIAFVPATKRAITDRGFDHMELIASELSDKTGIPAAHLLTVGQSHDQRELGRHQRARNMSDRFAIREGSRVPETVILIDDVATTGATLFAAAATLRKAGAKTLYALTFARA